MTRRSPPSWRAVLAASAGALSGLAGCLGGRPVPGGSGVTSTAGGGSPDGPADGGCETTPQPVAALDRSELAPASAVEAAPGDCPAIRDPRARFFCALDGAPDDCLADATDVRIVSSNAVGDDAPMAMVPGSAELELPGTLSFDLTNGTDGRFETNFHAWQLWKREDGRWYHVAPRGNVQPVSSLGPGERLRYCLTMDGSSYPDEHLHPIHPDEHDRGEFESWSYVVPALGGGEYAFALFGHVGGNDGSDRETGFVARFSLVGDPLELTTSGHVEDATADGERLTARWTYHDEAWASSRGRFTLGRVAAAEHPRRIVTEQAVRLYPDAPLRDALALLRTHDVEEVTLEGLADGIPAFRVPDHPLAYDGEVYEVETETTEELG